MHSPLKRGAKPTGFGIGGDTRIAYVVKVVRKYRWKRTALFKGGSLSKLVFIYVNKARGAERMLALRRRVMLVHRAKM